MSIITYSGLSRAGLTEQSWREAVSSGSAQMKEVKKLCARNIQKFSRACAQELGSKVGLNNKKRDLMARLDRHAASF